MVFDPGDIFSQDSGICQLVSCFYLKMDLGICRPVFYLYPRLVDSGICQLVSCFYQKMGSGICRQVLDWLLLVSSF
jgi:hypothetical protein